MDTMSLKFLECLFAYENCSMKISMTSYPIIFPAVKPVDNAPPHKEKPAVSFTISDLYVLHELLSDIIQSAGVLLISNLEEL